MLNKVIGISERPALRDHAPQGEARSRRNWTGKYAIFTSHENPEENIVPSNVSKHPNKDILYRRSGFASERERVEHLFALYEKSRAPLEAGVKGKSQSNGRRKGK